MKGKLKGLLNLDTRHLNSLSTIREWASWLVPSMDIRKEDLLRRTAASIRLG